MSFINPQRPEVRHYSLEAEQQLLGSLIMADSPTPLVMREGGAALFHHPLHAHIYEQIEQKYKHGDHVSLFSLKAALEASDLLNEAGGPAYLVRLHENAIYQDLKAIKSIVEILAEYARKRALRSFVADVHVALDQGEMSALDIAARLEGRVVGLGMTAQADRPTSMLAAVTQAVGKVNDAYHGKIDALVRFGLPALDAVVPGLYPGELTLLGGRPGMGKSAVALTISLNVARVGHTVVIVSLEMTSDAMALRALSEATSHAGNAVPYSSMRRGDMEEEQFKTVVEVAQDVSKLPIHFLSRAYSNVEAMIGGVRQIARTDPNLRLVVVDYTQLLKAEGRDRFQQVTTISIALKSMAMSLGIPVLALSQLSRTIEGRDDKRPQLSDLRESGQLEQDADNVLFCYRPEYYLEKEEPDGSDLGILADWHSLMEQAKGKLEIIVSKQRMGLTGTAKCRCNLATNSVWG